MEWTLTTSSSALEDGEGLRMSIAEFVRAHHPDGIFCFSDYIAYDAFCLFESLGIRVPDEVSIIGFADEPLSDISRPRISTVHQPAELVGNAQQKFSSGTFSIPTTRPSLQKCCLPN